MPPGETVATVQLFVVLIGLMAVVGLVLHRLAIPALPYSVALVVCGLIVGAACPGLDGHVTPELILIVLLPGLVFEASYRLELDELRGAFGGIALLAAPGVLVAAAIVAVALNVGTGMPLEIGFVVGAIVAATDPAAVVSTFQRLPTPGRLNTLVQGESLLNDGTALVTFAIAVKVVTGGVTLGGAVLDFAVAIAVSGAIGAVTGFVASRLIALVDDHLLELTISLVAAYGTYMVTDAIHQSGIIATVVAGVVLGNYGRRHGMSAKSSEAIDTVWEFVGFLLTAAVFLLIGLAIPLARLVDALPWIVWGILGAQVGRAVVIYGVLGGASRLRSGPGRPALPTAWLHVLFWSGLRGAVAVAIALSLPLDFPQRALLQEITFGIVLFTLAVQGTTVELLCRRTGALLSSRSAAGPAV
ncbi:MAG: monovalent cation:H+ antiporter, family [Chloroflexota bacterium]|jgi:CPA1 family monovalent cation:H+ antiporter|nr:monovalent cation:H+ antiporter, family [Chloroflexota bacterium]